ncbi:hypothetical protein QTH25_13125 [Clostridium perfringens]|nr:hypothetical protein [Clostridium perfringens]
MASVILIMGGLIINKTNCDYCGEKFNNILSVDKETCDICFGWKEHEESEKNNIVECIECEKLFDNTLTESKEVCDRCIGYNEGYKVGSNEGIETGYNEGYNLGIKEGSKTAYDNGYNVGYNKGSEATTKKYG